MKLFLGVLLAGAAVIVGLVVFSGPSSSEPESSSAAQQGAASIAQLNVGGAGKMSTVDHSQDFNTFSGTMLAMALESLVKVTEDGAVEPHLAESVENPNPKTWVYHLREGVKFWDGTELTAEDVVYSLDHARGPDSQAANYYLGVRDIEATDQYTVEVTLKRPDASWKYTPAFAGLIFQKAFAEKNGKEFGSPQVLTMGTGPWKIDSLDPTRGMELSSFDEYWGGKPTIERISVKFLADETSMAVAFRAGEIDLAFPSDTRGFTSTADVELVAVPHCESALFSMNQNVAPWSDVHVRRAVAHAVNREGMADALAGAVTPIEQIIPPEMMRGIASEDEIDQLYGSLPSYEFDLEQARQELAQSEYPDGFSAELATTSAQPDVGVVAQVLADDLKEVGIDLKIKKVPSAEFNAQFYGPREDLLIFLTGFGCATPDPSWFPNLMLDSANARESGTNLADYKNPRVDELLQTGLGTEDPAERLAAYSEVLEITADELPYQQLYVTQTNLALADKFSWPGFFGFFAYGHPWPLAIESN